MATLFSDVACTVCGCVCDDLTLHVDSGRIVAAERACGLSEPWFLGQSAEHASPTMVDGVPASFQDAVQRAADILSRSRAPLVYGSSRSGTAGQRAAVELAETLGATIDPAGSHFEAASILAMQSVGMSTATLGEVRNRADLVIYWGCDPIESQPRHVERFVDAPGTFVPGGRRDRQLIVVDVEPTATAALADRFVRVEPGEDFELLQLLRASIKGVATASRSSDEVATLAEQMKSCRYGAIFLGPGLVRHGVAHANVATLLELVAALNAHTRFVALPMRSVGAANVLTWLTGYPMAVSFAQGYPRYDPDVYRGEVLLERGEVDAVVLVGGDEAAKLSSAAQHALSQLPVIALGSSMDKSAAVSFTTATCGVHRPGTAYRMDDVPIPLRAVLESTLPSEADVLSALNQECASAVAQSTN